MPKRNKIIDLSGWQRLKDIDIPKWVIASADKKAGRLRRWNGFFITGKNYKYYIDHIGGQGNIIYRKKKYRTRIDLKLLLIIVLLFILIFLLLKL